MTHICVGDLTITGPDNGLSPVRHQAIIWTSAGILLILPLGTNFSEILIEILILSFKKMRLKVSSAKWRPFCLGLNVLTHQGCVMHVCTSKIGHHEFRWWLVVWSMPSHYLTQGWFIDLSTFDKNLGSNSNDFHSRKSNWNVFCKLLAIFT